MSSAARDGTAMLNEIERHVAWFYAAAVRISTDTATHSRSASEEPFLRRVLRTTETFRTAIGWLHDVKPHPDEILDLAVILARALEYWERARAAWQPDPSHAALSAAAGELAETAEALEDVIATAPWFGNDAVSSATLCGTSPRKVQ